MFDPNLPSPNRQVLEIMGLFIIVFKICFFVLKNNKNKENMDMFDF